VASGDDAEGRPWTALSRRHVIEVDRGQGSISIFGGKLTDCLNVGAEVALAAATLGIALPRRHERWYGEPPEAERLQFEAEALRAGLDDGPRLWRRYGLAAGELLRQIARDPTLAERVVAGHDCRRVELAFSAQHEMVVTLEDFLRRRTELALVRRGDELARAPGLREACAEFFGEASL
jgi:glycerol-3-phosphate dehydrogenase